MLLDALGIVTIAALLPFVLAHKSTPAVSSCPPGFHTNHEVVIQNDKVIPSHIQAPLCDTLTITNYDDIGRLVAFGPHENHVAYDGVTERLVGRGQSVVVTLVQAGNFRFHDHLHDEVQGTFTVTTTVR